MSKEQTSLDVEIQGRFSTSNQLFSLGANIGVKSFEHLITISSGALGLLFSYRQGIFSAGEVVEIGPVKSLLWLVATFSFALTIIASIIRNYHAGNGLVFLSNYIRSRAHKRLNPNNKDYQRNEARAKEQEADAFKARRKWSGIARFSFYWAISSLAVFILFDDFQAYLLPLIMPLFKWRLLDANLAPVLLAALNFIFSLCFAILNSGESSSAEESQAKRKKRISKK